MWCVHPGGGLSWGYWGLIGHLQDRPIYGLQARGLDCTTPLATSVPAMANDYLEQILAIQKEGPFFLLGWSFGGVVAHAIAAELNRRGHEVALLALVASAPARGDEPVVSSQSISESDFLSALCTLAKERYGITIDDPAYESFAKAIAAVMKNNTEIVKDFASPIYEGPSVLFIPTIDEAWSPERHIFEWAPYLKGPVSAYHIEGTHADMDRPESMATIGRILDRALGEPTKAPNTRDGVQ